MFYAYLTLIAESLYESMYPVLVCWLACEDKDTRPCDLHTKLDGSEDDMVILLVTSAM